MKLRRSLVALLCLVFSFGACAAKVWKDYEVPTPDNFVVKIGNAVDKELDPNNISMLVWNMYKADMPTWEEDYLMLSENKDILLLQEMFLNNKMVPTFEKQIEYEFQTATSFIYKKENARTGVINASRIQATKVIPLQSPVREPIINTPKMVMVTTHKIAGLDKELMVANIHAINFVTVNALRKQIRQVADVLKKHNGPYVFAGDFNTWSKGKRRILDRILIKELGMEEVQFPKNDDDRMVVLGQIIDFIFIKGLNYTDAKVWGDVEGSDHKAMTVNLSVK